MTVKHATPLCLPIGCSHWLRATLFVAAWTVLFAGQVLAQRNLKDIPDPDPGEELRSLLVAEGFEVNLFAADPQIAKPIQMNFDERGRLWIASSEIYPHIKPGQKADDKILVLEDTDRDGRSDRTTVFARGLLIPTGVVPGDGGVYVANSTELIHLRDSDGDGKADRSRVVLSGFGTEDTHHLLHTLRWGPDGALYMNQSIYIHSHIETPYGVRRLGGGGIWQFRPETNQLEILCRGFVNPWGHHFDRWGQSFATDGAYGEGINYVFPGSVFVTAPGASRILHGLNPGSPKHCGLEILSGRHLPPAWQGNMITNDFRAHRVCRFVVSEDGAGYASKQEAELIKTKHVAFRPIDVKMGPDGAIYIADWYNPIIQHGEVDFRDSRRDQTHGRIWRVTAKGRALLKPAEFEKASIVELLELLKVPEQWTRLHAKLTLKTRKRAEVIAALGRWWRGQDAAASDQSQWMVEALWAGQCVQHIDPQLLAELLRSADHRVRAAAMRVVSTHQADLPQAAGWLSRGTGDLHPRVRLEAVRGLAVTGRAVAALDALRVLDQPMDRFLDFALWQAMRDLQPQWLAALNANQLNVADRLPHLLFALQSIEPAEAAGPLLRLISQGQLSEQQLQKVLAVVAANGGPKELATVLEFVLRADSELPAARRAVLLTALGETTRRRRIKPSGDLTAVVKLFEHEHLPLRVAAVNAAGVWKVQRARVLIQQFVSSSQNAPQLRLAAISALADLGGPDSVKSLVELAAAGERPRSERQAAAIALVPLVPKRAAQIIVALLATSPPDEDPAPLLAATIARKNGPGLLADALQGRKIAADIAKRAVRIVQSSSQPSVALMTRLREAGSLNDVRWKLDGKLLGQLVAEVQKQGDAHRGEAIYRRKDLQCMNCHAVGGAGGKVGPDLLSVGASAQVDYLIESLIEPTKKVKENFHAVSVLDEDGNVFSGIPVRETKRELVLRTAQDKELSIPVDNIAQKKQSRSLMPDGTVDTLTRSELVDLVRFLSELGKVGDFAVGKSQYARRWQSLRWSPQANRRLNRTSFDTAASNETVFEWEPAYTTVAGGLPCRQLPPYKPNRQNDPTAFVRCQLDVSTGGTVALQWNEVAGLSLWVNGKPRPVTTKISLELPVGRHTFTVAVNQVQRTTPLQLELMEVEGSPAQGQWVSGK